MTTAQASAGRQNDGRAAEQRAAEQRPVEAVRALSRVSRLLETASVDLSLPHYRVLAAIAAGDERATRIASRLAVGKPSVSAAVESLSARGLLTRSEVAVDQRSTCLTLTEDGKRLLAEVEAEMASRLDAVAARTPSPEALLDALVTLGPAIETLLAERRGQMRR
ncbi:MAG: MarR family winged helix-turn-helix transcriptional regulator [Acidimicrobiales bacterium]